MTAHRFGTHRWRHALVALGMIAGGWLIATPATAQAPEATFLAMTVAPGTLPIERTGVEALFIQMLGPSGEAATRAQDTSVRLASSDPRLVQVPAAVTIPAGESAVAVALTVTGEGGVTLTAQSPGLSSAQATVSGIAAGAGIEGGQLDVTFAPGTFFSGESTGPAWVTISLLGADGQAPLVAAADTAVRLLSSNIEALDVASEVTIPAGAFSVTVPVDIGVPGSANVTALRSGVGAGSATATVRPPSTAPAVRLVAVAVPNRVLPGSAEPVRIVVQALAENGAPAPFPCGELQFASASPAVIEVPDRASPACSAGQQAVVIDATPGQASGSTTITIAGRGVEAAEISLSTRGGAPQRLAATVAPGALMYGGRSAGWLVLQVLDGAGSPVAVAGDTTLSLSGPAGLVPAAVDIPAGASSVVVPLGTLAAGSAATIDVAGPGLEAASVALTSAGARALPRDGRSNGFPAFQVANFSISVPLLIGLVLAVLAALLGASYLVRRREEM